MFLKMIIKSITLAKEDYECNLQKEIIVVALWVVVDRIMPSHSITND